MAEIDPTREELLAENAALRRRIADLEGAEAKLRAICASTTDMITVIDHDGRHLEILPTQSPHLDSMRRVVGKSIKDVAPEAAERSLANIRKAISTGRVFTQELSTPGPDGQLWWASTVTHLTDTTALWITRESTAQHRLVEAEAERRYFQALAENTPVGVSLSSPSGALVYANPAYRAMTGQGDAILGKTIFDIYTEPKEILDGALSGVIAHGTWQGLLTIRQHDGAVVPCDVSMVKLDAVEEGQSVCAAIVRDLTHVHRAEQENLALKEQLIETQQAMLRELSTPLIPVAAGVIAVPLVGAIDVNRAQEVLERLLQGIAEQRSHTAILDITGVTTVDREAAAALTRVAQAARLLGTQVILTGIRPSVAQVLVEMQADLAGTVTLGNLESGIAHALRRNRGA